MFQIARNTTLAQRRWTTTIADQAVDKVTLTTPEGSEKQVFLVANATLFLGLSDEDGGTRDAEGYPNALEATGAAKQ